MYIYKGPRALGAAGTPCSVKGSTGHARKGNTRGNWQLRLCALQGEGNPLMPWPLVTHGPLDVSILGASSSVP